MIQQIFKVESLFNNNLFKLKGYLLRLYFKIHGCKVGERLRCHTFPRFRIPPHNNFFIGDDVTIGYDITFEILKGGSLHIANFVKLTQNIIVSSGCEIKIGAYSLFGENTSIRDGDHNISFDTPITFQDSTYMPILIGKDVWIGAGCLILKGSNIPDGVIIGANSVVINSSKMESYNIYAGSPIKNIGSR